jgi:hypothetical protein
MQCNENIKKVLFGNKTKQMAVAVAEGDKA